MRFVILLLAAGVLAGAAVLVLSRSEEGSRTAGRAPAVPVPEEVPAPEPPHPPSVANETEALRAALEGGDPLRSQDEAAALRRLVRTDAAARDRVERMLLAEDTPSVLRQALALVLGTLAGSDPVLLEVLARFGGDAEVARCVILALGATREPPDDDEVFGLGDRPWGQHGPGGLGITVRRAIEQGAVREVLERCLLDARDVAREAAAQALRHSTGSADVRTAFAATLSAEPSDDVATVLGEALAGWAGGGSESTERTAVVNLLLARAGDDGLDGYRFRMEDDFRRIVLDPAQVATLEARADATQPLGVRSFALSVLAAAAPESARPLCVRVLGADEDAAVRDLAARLLGTLPPADGTIAALVDASRDDAAWNVRWQAVDALGRFPDDARAVDAIRAATRDDDARVAQRAAELLR